METKITSYSHNSTDGLRYLYYGSYKKTDVVSGKVHFNQPHSNHNGVKHRNEFFTGVDCHTYYKSAIKDFEFYNRQKPGRKVQAMMLTLSFSKKDFNFRKRNDVLRAIGIGRRFVKKVFPNRCAVIVAQMDNANATPHLHCFISAFDESNLRSFSSRQKNIYRLHHVADKVVHQYNVNNPNHKITEMTKYRKQNHHHNRTPTPAEMSVLKPLSRALALEPTSQNSFRKDCRKYGLTASFKRGRRRSGGRRKQGRRRSRRGLVFKSTNSNGYIKASQLQWFDKYCPGISHLHNYRLRRTLFKKNWAKYQANKRTEIKTIATKMNKAHIIHDLYYVGNVDGFDDYKWRAKHQAGVLVSLKSYTKRDGNPDQSIRYRLKGHNHSYSGYQFIKAFGQSGRRFNNYDVQNQIGKNRETIINFEDQNDGSLESTFNAVGTTGKRDLDSQLSITPSTVQDDEQNPKSKTRNELSDSNEPTPSATPTTDDIAKKRQEIHDYYQTKKDDRKAIDKFLAKLDRAVKAQARAVEVTMIRLRKRTSKWLKAHAIKPIEYKVIKRSREVTSEDIKNNPLNATKKFNDLLSGRGQAYLRTVMLLERNNHKIFKKSLVRLNNKINGRSFTPITTLPNDEAVFAHSLHDLTDGVSRSELTKINHFLENDTIIDQLTNHRLAYRFTHGKDPITPATPTGSGNTKAPTKDNASKVFKKAGKDANKINGDFESKEYVKGDKEDKKEYEKEKKGHDIE